MKFIRTLMLKCAGVLFSIAACQDSPQLTEYLNLAMDNNPEIKAQAESVIALTRLAKYNGSLSNPTITAGTFFTPVETKVGPQEWKIGFSQKLPWFGKLSTKKRIGLLQADIASQQLRAVKLRVIRDVRIAYEKFTAFIHQGLHHRYESKDLSSG